LSISDEHPVLTSRITEGKRNTRTNSLPTEAFDEINWR